MPAHLDGTISQISLRTSAAKILDTEAQRLSMRARRIRQQRASSLQSPSKLTLAVAKQAKDEDDWIAVFQLRHSSRLTFAATKLSKSTVHRTVESAIRIHTSCIRKLLAAFSNKAVARHHAGQHRETLLR